MARPYFPSRLGQQKGMCGGAFPVPFSCHQQEPTETQLPPRDNTRRTAGQPDGKNMGPWMSLSNRAACPPGVLTSTQNIYSRLLYERKIIFLRLDCCLVCLMLTNTLRKVFPGLLYTRLGLLVKVPVASSTTTKHLSHLCFFFFPVIRLTNICGAPSTSAWHFLITRDNGDVPDG